MKTLIATSLAALLCAATTAGFADESKKSDSDQGQSGKSSEQSKKSDNSGSEQSHARAYMGLAVEKLPEHLATHLSKQLGGSQGLLVEDVADDSPADKAGIEPQDVVVSADGEKVSSPEQFVRMIRRDKPGREVSLEIIHKGESKKVKVTLGQRPAGMEGRRWSQRPDFERSGQSGSQQSGQQQPWLAFDAMTLTRLDKDHFKAEIKYRNDQGKMETHTFQGTRKELRKDIDSEKDLPASERADLLRALDLAQHPFELLPGFFFQPDEGGQQGGQGGGQWQRDTAPWR